MFSVSQKHKMYQKHTHSIYHKTLKHTIKHKTKLHSFPPNTTSLSLTDHFASSLLQCCSNLSLIKQGQQIHAQTITNGLTTHNAILSSKIIGMYVLCDSFIDAKKLFYRVDLRYAAPWNWMIRGFTMMGRFDFSILWYFKMLGYGTLPDKYTFPYVVKACGSAGNVGLGRFVHGQVRGLGFEDDVFVGSSFIKMYADWGFVEDARYLFDKLLVKDIVLWNVMLNGYVRNGEFGRAVELFLDMRGSGCELNSVTFACMLSVCASRGMGVLGAQVHCLSVGYGLEMELSVTNTLLAMYSRCRQLFDAQNLFDTMAKTDVITWNGMIGGYVQNGLMDNASELLQEMVSVGVKPDAITFSSFLPSISDSLCPMKGKEIHGYITRNGISLDAFLKSALIDVYFKCRDVEMARKVFMQSTTVDTVICTTMISGYVLNGMNKYAVEVFRWLLQEGMVPNPITLASVLPACAGLAALKSGMELHGYILKEGLEGTCYVGSAISDMYAKCGRLELAYLIFNRMSERDAVCWNSMITSCAQNGKPEEAVDLFRQMGMRGIKYDCVSISAALSACASLPALCYGKEIHCFITRNAFVSDVFAESALIDVYGKCGDLDSACHVFNMMPFKSKVSWNSIISAYGNHGDLRKCISLFNEMLENRVQPDHLTFLGIMSACSHVGEVDTGVHFFHIMTEEYGIPARMEHYACMVDMLGRAGHLSKAFQTIKNMPFVPDAGIWGSLLGACRVHGVVELGEVASRHLFKLDSQNSGYYVLLSHVHADAGQWGNVQKVRSLMKERGVHKVPGYSWIEVNNGTHMFVAADESHPQSEQIYSVLKSLLLELWREGYVQQSYLPLHAQTAGT